MKKLLTALLAVLLILAFVGCSAQTDTPATPEETLPVVDVTPEPTEQASPTPANEEVGIIIGDVFYKDIPISRLFLEPFVDVLGEPTDQHGAFSNYEGLSIMGLLGSVAHDEAWA